MIGWWRLRRQRKQKRKNCFHHDHRDGSSWIKSRLINNGAGKMFWCGLCGQTWFV